MMRSVSWSAFWPVAVATLVSTTILKLPSSRFGDYTMKSTCVLLETAGLKLYRPNSTSYRAREAEYYSASAVMRPGCIVQPTSTNEVAAIIKTLNSETTTNWAVRSGGHMSWGPAADINDGVTIDLGLMNKTEYDAGTKVAKIGGGALWKDVYSTLEPLGVTVPGGRTSTVGIGGFTLGGGNNFFSGQVGFACDNVVNFEVVLASGEIVNANKTANSDLFKALKGGGSNFGALSYNGIYGGLVTHALNHTDAVVNAFSNFVDNIKNYQAGSGFSFWAFPPGATESVIVSALHDTTNTENAPAYAEYHAIGDVIASTERHGPHLDFAVELEFAKGNQNVWFAITVKNNPEILKFITEQHNQFIKSWKDATGDKTFSIYTVFQPMPTVLFDHGVARGGNVLGMDRQTANCVLFQVFMVFNGADLEPAARRMLGDYRETVRGRSVELAADIEWEYINYADKTQGGLASYGAENVAFMRRVAREYDPEGAFQVRSPGGFKLPSP